MKSAAEHKAEQHLESVSEIANRGAALTTMADEPVAQLRALVGIGEAVLALTAQLRESRQLGNFPTSPSVQQSPPIIVGCGCAAGHETDPARHTEIRAVRGATSLALLLLGGMNVLLVIVVVVAVLT